MRFSIGDVYVNSKTNKKYVFLFERDSMLHFRIFNTEARFALHECQTSNFLRDEELSPPELPKTLPEIPRFLR